MYRVCVPMLCAEELRLQSAVKYLKLAKADTVFLVFDRVLCNDAELYEKADLLKKNKAYLEENGFRVAAWLAPTVGYGGTASCDNGANEKFRTVRTSSGRTLSGGFCPLDEGFVNEFLKTLGVLIKTGVKEILFEDDFTLSGGKMFKENGCCCEEHMKLLRARIGEDISLEFLDSCLWSEKPNRYRDEFLALQGETLADFASKIEKLAHEIDPEVRIGLSANASSYDIEGICLPRLAKIIAGDTRPFVRMTGAPYWDQIPSLAANIECVRLQEHWFDEFDTELLTEGDTYPRPRHWVPSAYLEGYDMVLRADGKNEGILKYMFDYLSKPEYEDGYFIRHAKNEPHYLEIGKRFSGKRAVGLNIFENTELFAGRDFTGEVSRKSYGSFGGYMPLVSQWFATDNSIPTAYGADDYPSLVFGENAKHVTEKILSHGAVLDAQAAKILTDRGIDVGIMRYSTVQPSSVEYFSEFDDYITAIPNKEAVSYKFELREGAKVLSEYLLLGAGGLGNYSEKLWGTAERMPACYFYENADGQRFLVYSFVAENSWGKGVWRKGAFRGYYRQRQLVRGVEMISGKKLPAVSCGNPNLYILCKRGDDGSLAVGLWNFFADEILEPVIELDEKYKNIDFYNCEGRLEGDCVRLNAPLPPYGFAFFTVK